MFNDELNSYPLEDYAFWFCMVLVLILAANWLYNKIYNNEYD